MTMHFRAIRALAGLALLAGSAAPASAAFVMTFAPDGYGNVQVVGSGTLNVDGLSMQPNGGPFRSTIGPNYVFGATAIAGAAANDALVSAAPVDGPFAIGTADPFFLAFATIGSGDIVGLVAGSLIVPRNYVSGSALSNQALYAGQSIASLRLTPGTYHYTWGSGGTADSLSIVVSTVAIPEPGALSLVLTALGGIALVGRRQRSRAVAAS